MGSAAWARSTASVKVSETVWTSLYLLRNCPRTALMAAVLYAAIRILPEGAIWTLILVAIGIAAYAVFAVLTGAVSKEDLAPILRRFGRRGKQKKGE